MKNFSCFLILSVICFYLNSINASEDNSKLFEKSSKLYEQGRWKEALDGFKKYISEDPVKPDDNVKNAFEKSVECLSRLGNINEFDELAESSVKKHPVNWKLLVRVASEYTHIRHDAYIINDTVSRIVYKSGGRYADLSARDRVRAIQLFVQAEPLLNKDGVSDKEKFDFYMAFAGSIMNMRDSGNAWKLQVLTDIAKLPEPESGRYSDERRAPVDKEGSPVYYKLPASFESSGNDGERWRWLLSCAAKFDSAKTGEPDFSFAEFLHDQFDVRTLVYRGDNSLKTESLIQLLSSLTDDETIANLASGAKRFKMPDEFNYIKIFKKICDSGSLAARKSMLELINVYKDRRQYDKAAALMKYYADKYPAYSNDVKDELNQIVGNWGTFEPSKMNSTDSDIYVDFRFRNVTQVSFDAYKLNMKEFLNDVKKMIRDDTDPAKLREIEPSSIGTRIVDKDEKKYIQEKSNSWTENLTPRKKHFDSIIPVKMPMTKPGVYLVTANLKDGNTSRIIVWVTDTVIVRKMLDESALYFVADAKTGAPVQDASLSLFGYKYNYIDNEKKIKFSKRYKVSFLDLNEKTDENGIAVTRKLENNNDLNWLTVAESKDGRFAVMGFNRIWFNRSFESNQAANTRIFSITDRPVYRPGQKVYFKLWAAIPKYDNETSLANKDFTVRILNAKYEEIFKKKLKTDEYGGLSDSLTLPEEAALGNYTIEVPKYGHIGRFRVEEYKRPEYEVTVNAPKETVALGDKFSVTINAKYYFGAPVTNAKVKYKVLRSPHKTVWFPPSPWDWLYKPGYWWFASDYSWYPGWTIWGTSCPSFGYEFRGHWERKQPELVCDNEVDIGPDGTVKFEIDSAMTKVMHGDTDSVYKITAEVTDLSRRTIVANGSVIASVKPFNVYCWTDRGYYMAGDTLTANYAAVKPDGKPVKGSGLLKLLKIKYQKDGQPVEEIAQTWKINSGDEGKGEMKISVPTSGQYRLSAIISDPKNRTIEGAYIFSVWGKSITDMPSADDFNFNEIEIVNDKKEYAPGEKVSLMINTKQKDATVLLFVRPSGNGVCKSPEILKLQGRTVFKQLEILKGDMPNFFIEAVTVSNAGVHTAVKEIIVPPERKMLNVSIVSAKPKYSPGDKASIKVKITDLDGKPVSSSVVMTVYDKSIEYISGGSNVQPVKDYFWKWHRSFQSVVHSNTTYRFFNILKSQEQGLRGIGCFGNVMESSISESDTFSRSEAKALPAAAPMAKMKTDNIMVAKESMADSSNFTAKGLAGGAAEPTTKQPDVMIRENFAETAYWAAAIQPDANGEAVIEVPMPDSLTTWKIMAWTMGQGTRVGQGETEIITSKNLILRMQTPRFFIENDEVVLSAIVHNYMDSVKKVTASIVIDGKTLVLNDRDSRTEKIPVGGEVRFDWRVKASKEGETSITMKAVTEGASDGVKMSFPVFVHGMMKTVSNCGVIRDGANGNSALLNLEVPKCREADTRLEVRYSPTLAGALVDALPYLVDYPYGCTEQTLNRFLPVAITVKVLKQMKLDFAAIKEKTTNLNSQEIGDDKTRAQQWKRYKREAVFDDKIVSDVIKTSLKRLAIMQLDDGGWGWFSGYAEKSDTHITALVVHGLQTAKKADIKFDEPMLLKSVEWLTRYQDAELKKLQNAPSKTLPYKDHADNMDAFVYMVLSDAGKSNAEMKEFIFRDRLKLSVYSLAMFGNAMYKEKDEAKLYMIMKNIEQYLVYDAENQTAYLNLPERDYWWCWYGSSFEAHAYYLKLLALTEPKAEKTAALVKYMLNNRKNGTYWNSTRDTALCIEAIADFFENSGENAPDMTVEIAVDGKKVKTEKITKDNLFTFDNKLIVAGADFKTGKHKVQITRNGTGPLYYNSYLSYFTLEDFITKAGLEIKVDRNYYKLKKVEKSVKASGSSGQVIDMAVEKYDREKLSNMASLKSGDLVEIELVIESKNNYEYIILEDMKPAGFEPLEVRSGYSGNCLGAYVEYRDAKVCFFVRSLPHGKFSISYRMKAEIPGIFSTLPTKVWGMYAPELKANSDELKLKVKN